MPNPVPATPGPAGPPLLAATAAAPLLSVTEGVRNRRLAPRSRHQAPRPTTIRPQQTVAQPRRRAGGCTGTPTTRTTSSAPDNHDVWVWWHAGPDGTVRTEP
jgi:hypothetical protein